MKKKVKIIISLLLTVALISSVFAYVNFNAYASTNGTLEKSGLHWALDDDGLFTVNGNGYGEDFGNVTNRPPWSSLKSSIKEVVINEGVQAIGDYWFSGCSNLTSVTLADSMIKIGARCFQSCSKLESIVIPENCCEYYNYIFSGCSALKWVVLPRDNTASSYLHAIPDYMFNGCSSLENVMVGEDYTTISANAFKSCTRLSAIIWQGDTISSIGSNFPSDAKLAGSSSIQSWCSSNSKTFVNVEGSCGTSLGYSYDPETKKLTFTGSGTMTSSPWNVWKHFIYDVDFGSATSIASSAFYGCEYLGDELIIPANISKINSNAFYGAGCDYYVFDSDSISIASDAFGGKDKITFFGRHNSGTYDYVFRQESDNPGWKFYCLDNHLFSEIGGECDYCDKVQGSLSIDECDQHRYVYQYRIGNDLFYKCTHCDIDDYRVNLRELYVSFADALSADVLSECDGRFDITRDGSVNGKDLAALRKMLNGRNTDYDRVLTNENATKEAKNLYAFINNNHKSKIISGQQESTWMGSEDYEFNYIYNKTGKYPAIRGFDFMNDDFSGCVRRAKAWANRGGIVTICWHCSSAFDKSYDACKADEFTTEQWEAVLDESTPEHAAFIAGVDKAADALLELQNAGIPVLWRPFHEFDGAWFWWGKGGSEYFKRLWIMMYNHFTYDKGLNNLIWVLGYSHNGTDYGNDLADWYPGNRYVDITGADSYEVSENGAEARLYDSVYRFVGEAKPLVMHETGLIPTVQQLEGVPWGYFMTWHTTYLTEDNPTDNLSAVYNSDYVITLDEVEGIY